MMRHLGNSITALVLLGTFSACKDRGSSHGVKEAEASETATKPTDLDEINRPITCDQGEPHSFMADKVDPIPENLRIKGFDGAAANLRPLGMGVLWFKLRLDVCVHEAEDGSVRATLVRMVGHDFGSRKIFPKDRIVKVEGLEEALFGDYSKLAIEAIIPDVLSSREQRLVVASLSNGTEHLVGIYTTASQPNGAAPLASVPTAAVLKSGNPYADALCQSEWMHDRVITFKVATATMEAHLCTGLAAGATTAWNIVKLTVKDSSLDPARQVYVIEGDEANTLIKSQYHHHNRCDSLYIKTPHAEYALTAAIDFPFSEPKRVKANIEVVSNAPACVHPHTSQCFTSYRVRYDAAPWKEGQTEPSHFLFPHLPCAVDQKFGNKLPARQRSITSEHF